MPYFRSGVVIIGAGNEPEREPEPTGVDPDKERAQRTTTSTTTTSKSTTTSSTSTSKPPSSGGTTGTQPKEEAPKEEPPKEEEPAGPTMSILSGATWYVDESGVWYAVYKLPGSDTFVVFEASEEQMDAIFGEGVRPESTSVKGLDDLVGRDNYYFGGNIGEVEGEGSFEAEVNRTITLAKDAGLVPPELDSPEIWDLIYLAETEGWTDQRLWNEISKTQTFKQAYKGIEVLQAQGLSVQEAVKAYKEYQAGVSQLLRRYGYEDTTVSPEIMEQLLKQGHSLEDVAFVFNIFNHMKQNQGALDAFNQILEVQGLAPLDDEGMFLFLTGHAPTELYEIWESSQILEQATALGLEDYLTAAEAVELAAMTQGQLASSQITGGLQQAAATILRYRRDIDLGRYNLDIDDIIDISLGLNPRSGRSVVEIEETLQRVLQEAQAAAQQISPFFGFTRFGTPQARSFARFRVSGL